MEEFKEIEYILKQVLLSKAFVKKNTIRETMQTNLSSRNFSFLIFKNLFLKIT